VTGIPLTPVRAEPGGSAADPAEAATLIRVQAGDREAFDPVVRRYLRRAYTVAYRLLGHREDAEDVVQEAFLAALTNIDSFDPSRPFGPWLYRIVVTRGLNFRKSRSRRITEPLDDAGVPTAEAGPAAAAEQAGLAETVAGALRQLPDRQRTVVQLFELDGFSGAEIGAMLGLSAGTVRWHLHQARQTLRGLLADLKEPAG
jgi:RNA polymerase sigma-70 factor (ECF subfamily)